MPGIERSGAKPASISASVSIGRLAGRSSVRSRSKNAADRRGIGKTYNRCRGATKGRWGDTGPSHYRGRGGGGVPSPVAVLGIIQLQPGLSVQRIFRIAAIILSDGSAPAQRRRRRRRPWFVLGR